jgi:hypothetical protein
VTLTKVPSPCVSDPDPDPGGPKLTLKKLIEEIKFFKLLWYHENPGISWLIVLHRSPTKFLSPVFWIRIQEGQN